MNKTENKWVSERVSDDSGLEGINKLESERFNEWQLVSMWWVSEVRELVSEGDLVSHWVGELVSEEEWMSYWVGEWVS